MDADFVSVIHAEWHRDPGIVPLKTFDQELAGLRLMLGMCLAGSCFDFEEASSQSGEDLFQMMWQTKQRNKNECEIPVYEIPIYGIKAWMIHLWKHLLSPQ